MALYMDRYIFRKACALFVSNLALLLFTLFLGNNNDYNLITLVTFLQFVMNGILIFSISKGISLPFIFYILSNIFHNGQLWGEMFGSNNNVLYILSNYSTEQINTAAMFVFGCHFFLTLGMILGANGSREYEVQINQNKLDDKILAKASLIIMCISLPFYFYKIFTWLKLYSIGGYIETYKVDMSGIAVSFSYLTIMALCLWIITNNNKSSTVKIIVIAFVISELIVMSTGNRLRAVIELICIFLFYSKRYGNRGSVLKGIFYCILGYILFGIVISITGIRSSGGNISLGMIWGYNFKEYIIDGLNEFGSTFKNVIMSIRYFSSSFSVRQLMKIVITPAHTIPGLASVIPQGDKIMCYIYNFPSSTYMGGSYIGECYFWGGKIVGMILPIIVGIVSSKAIAIFRNSKSKIVAVIITFALLQLTRGYLAELFRTSIWFYILIWFFTQRKNKYIHSIEEADI